MPKSAAVALSGGLDSVVLAHDLASQGYQLTVVASDYGQLNCHRELACARACAARLGAAYVAAEMPWIAQWLPGTALTDPSVELPLDEAADENWQPIVVPNRNGNLLLAPAFSIAAANRMELVAAAIHAHDHPYLADCEPAFLDSYNTTQGLGLKGGHIPKLHIPYLYWSKARICRRGVELGVPLEQTWSCFGAGEVHCGRCIACRERIAAFEEAAVPDPTVYGTGKAPTNAGRR